MSLKLNLALSGEITDPCCFSRGACVKLAFEADNVDFDDPERQRLRIGQLIDVAQMAVDEEFSGH